MSNHQHCGCTEVAVHQQRSPHPGWCHPLSGVPNRVHRDLLPEAEDHSYYERLRFHLDF